ncbi:hypothetical protein BDR22DRAFT_871205 [Usnea florida]
MLPRTFRRPASSAISAKHKSTVDDFLHQAQQAPPIIKKQNLDQPQLQRLSLTLNRPRLHRGARNLEEEAPLNGTPLPPGYHLVYFTPATLHDHLGKDGTDISYSPAQPFTRRMWAGGTIKWEKENPLRIGDDVTEITKLVSAEPKVTRTGEEMVVVGVEKIFENAKGLALIDRRDWVFRTQLSGLAPPQDYPESSARDDKLLPLPSQSQKSRDFLQTAVSLFRFSALTFNAHMIHYSRPWCRAVEGHRDIVVHGPLNLINMLDFWRDENADDCAMPRSIAYRATAPFYAGETYRALLERGAGTTSVKVWGHDGRGAVRVGMLGDVVD